jgi:hypothetical protein
MKSDFKSDALQMLQEGRVLGVAARPTVGIRFPANVQWPYADGRSEAQVRQKGIHQSSRFERLRIGIIKHGKRKAAASWPKDTPQIRFSRYAELGGFSNFYCPVCVPVQLTSAACQDLFPSA